MWALTSEIHSWSCRYIILLCVGCFMLSSTSAKCSMRLISSFSCSVSITSCQQPTANSHVTWRHKTKTTTTIKTAWRQQRWVRRDVIMAAVCWHTYTSTCTAMTSWRGSTTHSDAGLAVVLERLGLAVLEEDLENVGHERHVALVRRRLQQRDENVHARASSCGTRAFKSPQNIQALRIIVVNHSFDTKARGHNHSL